MTADTDATFYDNYVPGLKAGLHTLTAGQSLKWKSTAGDPPSKPQDPAEQSFLVRGPRFRLDPADIHHMFPPRQGTGTYHAFLPMLVLNKRALPWERDLQVPSRITHNPPNEFAGLRQGRSYPWVALLTFTEDELPAPGGSASPEVNPTRIQSLTLSQIIAGESPGPPANVLGPNLKGRLDADENPAEIRCHAIDVPKDTFVDLLPSFYDAAFLAHAREVATEGRKAQDPGAAPPSHPGWYSIVLSNRFTVPPVGASPTRNIMHLVSLEGFEAYLGPDGEPVAANIDTVRMVSLWSWTCTCLPDPREDFRRLMLRLISPGGSDGTDLLMRMPLPRADAVSLWIVGATEKLDAGTVSSLPLAAGAQVEVDPSVLLWLVDSTGKTLLQVTTSAKIAEGATTIPIAPARLVDALPAGTRVLLEVPPEDPILALRRQKALGSTQKQVEGENQTSLPLVVPRSPLIPAGALLETVAPDGARQWVTVSAQATPGDDQISIQPHTFAPALPKDSLVGLASDYLPIDRLAEGYVALSYGMRSGEDTFAWYRGPLAPTLPKRFLGTAQPAKPANPEAPRTASEAMIFDPVTGLFDQSYAVAFQTGRSLALGSRPFAVELLQWRREAHALIDLLLEYMRSPALAQTFESLLDADGNLTPTGIDDLKAILDPSLASKKLVDLLATQVFQGIARRIGRSGGFSAADRQGTVSGGVPAPPPAPPASVKKAIEELMQQPAVARLLQDMAGSGTEQIVEWLARTALLDGVPFDNLVPDERMLPVESIRFFYIDRNWIDALLDGALSVGIQSSRDSLLHQILRDSLHREVDDALLLVRDKLRPSAGPPTPLKTMAGFVLRSSVVSGWPGLELQAYSAADGNTPMKPLRLDKLSSNVMIGIYPDVPVKLAMNEPTEGLVFGIEDEGIHLRYVPGVSGAEPADFGREIDPQGAAQITPAEVNKSRRPSPAGSGALNVGGVDGLVRALEDKLGGETPTLGPAAFAVQMVKTPEQMLWTPKTGGNP